MAGRPPSEKTFANMLRVAISAAHENGGTNLRAVAQALVDKALTGDVPAIKEIGDRLDGKVPQGVVGEGGGALELVHTIKRMIVKPTPSEE